MSILQILESLKATSSKKEKEAILEANRDNETLKEFFRLSLNPYINFHMKKAVNYAPCFDGEECYDLLKAMEFLEFNIATRKITGHAAIDYARGLLESLSSDDAQVLQKVLKKNPDCGVQESTVNKIWKDLIPTYPVLLASAYSEKLMAGLVWTESVFAQLKSDGLRVNIIIDEHGGVTVYTRSGRPMDIHGRFDILGTLTKSVMIDGELLAILPNGEFADRQTGNGIASKAIKGTISPEEANMLHLVSWDWVPLHDFKKRKCEIKYEQRLGFLATFLDQNPQVARHISLESETGEWNNLLSLVRGKKVSSPKQAEEFYAQMISEGREGSITKSGSMLWGDERSKQQIKMKAEEECDLRVKAYKEGTGQFLGNLGSLECSTEDDKLEVSISGFSIKQRSEIWANITGKPVTYRMKGKEGFEDRIANPGDSFIDVGSIVSVKYNSVIKSRNEDSLYSLFLPRFVEGRFDKDVADMFKDLK